ncbi:cell division protein FtsJ [Cohnella sp. CFH 77786]|uniref:cyclic-phosphate processing receiver domain-containing protein n=1 Tax=Cohnella sp. CFH 77786 TaxID=2662265 RepID=UPI001C60CEB3|nr:cyclic-phosphate processing receiver domain-containing protein [Cohnella sp. CFH 77786]MBW5447706.1 cell division protein FtsJ [Cohnella sp. CFH 77786]
MRTAGKLFLDDRRPAPGGFRLVTSAKQCIEWMDRHRFRVVSLDYNLGLGKPTGYQVVRHMVRRNRFPDQIIIHSNSRLGREKMYRLLLRRKPEQVRVRIRPLPAPR